MTERVIATRFTADVSNFISGTNAAAAAARNQAQASTEVGTAMLGIGTVAAVGIGLAVAKFGEFDQAISNVKAATQESAANMGLLREAALEAGASSVFSATEAANAIEELGKAGLTTSQILDGGLDGALALASAGALGVAEAASIAAISVKQFNLEGSDVPHVADLLAAGAGKAVGDVTDLGAALGQAGLVANQTGLSIEETTGVLAAFADKGLLGSDAGTSLKSMLQALVPTSKEAAKEMERLGISAFDANGEFIGAAAFADNYKTALKDLNPEQQATTAKIIFGSDAVRAANVFYDQGAEGIQKYIDQTNDSGYAAKVAADRLNNLMGDVEKLGGAFDTYLIKSGSGANDMLRNLVQGATGAVDAVGRLPEPVLGGALAIGGLVTAVVLAGGVMLVAVPKIAAFKSSLSTVGISGRTAAIGVGLMSGGLAAAGIAFSLYAAKQATATANTAEFKESLDKSTGSLTGYTRELVAKKLAEGGAFEAAKAAGISQKELTEAVLEGGDAVEKVRRKLGENNTVGGLFNWTESGTVAAGNAQSAIREVSQSLEESKKDFDNQAAAAEGSAVATEEVTAATEAATVAVREVSEAQAEYLAGLAEQDAAFISLGGAYDTIIQKSKDSATATAESTEDTSDSWETFYDGFTVGLDNYLAELQTQVDAQNNWETNMILISGRVSQGVLDELASLGPEGAPLVAELVNASGEQLALLETQFAEKAADATGAFANTLYDSKTVIDAAAAQLGQDAANEIAGKLANKTSTVQQIMTDYGIAISSIAPTVTVHANTDAAYASLEALAARARAMEAAIMPAPDGSAGQGMGIMKRATGGAITGPGTGTSDSIPARLSNGEHVLTAADVRAMGGQGGVYEFRRGLGNGYARGGAVRYSAASESRGESSSSVTNRSVNQTWNVTSNGDDPSALAAKIDGRVNWSMRRLS
jgi:TP901 family phage tail tape measure protein